MNGRRFRNDLVLPHIVEQHAEEAAFLWTQRNVAADATHYRRFQFAQLDERVESHLDGLRIAGEAGWRIALEQLDRQCEPGELFAAALLALESGDRRRIETVTQLAGSAELRVRRGFVGAIAWCAPNGLREIVRSWDGSSEPFERYLALCACSVHRADAGGRLLQRIEDDNTLVRNRALRLAGELGRMDLADVCLNHLRDGADDEAFWPAWSAALLGNRDIAPKCLARLAVAGGTHWRQALEIAVRALGHEAGMQLVRGMARDPELRRAVIVAIGHLGDPSAVPWLIARMDDPELARVAGEAFCLITGIDLDRAGLGSHHRPQAAGDEAEDAAEDEDAALIWPDAATVHRWWTDHKDGFAPGQRFLCGVPVNRVTLEHLGTGGTQRQLRSCCYEMKLQSPGARLAKWRSRQRLWENYDQFWR